VSTTRRLAAVIVGVTLAVLAIAAACSSIDPVPPDPHGSDPSDPQELRNNPDASDAVAPDAGKVSP
jgi:hypothetical protein